MPCNPNALPKLDSSSGKCICSFPYKGAHCQECEEGYLAEEGGNNHTVCELELTRCSAAICNFHGNCLVDTQRSGSQKDMGRTLSDYMCRCDSRFSGRYCERCIDDSLEYPECKESKK